MFVKVNSEDRSVKGGTVKVWTRHGVMEVPRPGVRETKVEVVDGDRIRLKIRSPGFADPTPGDARDTRPISGRYRIAAFVGDEWIGTAAVTTATSREEERAANAAFDGSIRRARARADAAAAMGEGSILRSIPETLARFHPTSPARRRRRRRRRSTRPPDPPPRAHARA